jgi:hypothetical protein
MEGVIYQMDLNIIKVKGGSFKCQINKWNILKDSFHEKEGYIKL